jgi:hypothetical protein
MYEKEIRLSVSKWYGSLPLCVGSIRVWTPDSTPDVQTGTIDEEDQGSKYAGWDQVVSSPLTVLQATSG